MLHKQQEVIAVTSNICVALANELIGFYWKHTPAISSIHINTYWYYIYIYSILRVVQWSAINFAIYPNPTLCCSEIKLVQFTKFYRESRGVQHNYTLGTLYIKKNSSSWSGRGQFSVGAHAMCGLVCVCLTRALSTIDHRWQGVGGGGHQRSSLHIFEQWGERCRTIVFIISF